MDIDLFKLARNREGSESVEKLVEKLQRIKDENLNSLKEETSAKNTALHIALKKRHISFVEAINRVCPSSCKSLLLAQNWRGDTALHVAARAGLLQMVRKLIECAETNNLKKEMLAMGNKKENTALHEAARNRRNNVVQILSQQPELVCQINKDKVSALYMAVEGGCGRSVVYILNDVEKLPNEESRKDACRGPENRTPLHAAVLFGRRHLASVLLSKRKELATTMDDHGSYPLHYASALGDSWIVNLMLKSDTSVAYLPNNDGQFPIHVAARNGHIEVIKRLQRYCPDSCEAIDQNGWNAFHFAVQRGNVEVVNHILQSKELRELINEPNNEGMTALDIAKSDEELSKKIFRKIFICKALIEAKGRCGEPGLRIGQNSEAIVKMISYEDVFRVVPTIAALIITVAFAAAFAIPGGFNNEGKAVHEKKSILWLFIITDAIALFASIIVGLALLALATLNEAQRNVDDLLVTIHSISIRLMGISLVSLALAFFFGLLSILPIVLSGVVFSILLGLLGLVGHWIGFRLLFHSFKGLLSSLEKLLTMKKLLSIFLKRFFFNIIRLQRSASSTKIPTIDQPQSSNQV